MMLRTVRVIRTSTEMDTKVKKKYTPKGCTEVKET
jgi:hypothetical protein